MIRYLFLPARNAERKERETAQAAAKPQMDVCLESGAGCDSTLRHVRDVRDVKWHKDHGAAPLSDFIQNVVINFLLMTACLSCNGLFAVLLLSGVSGMQKI